MNNRLYRISGAALIAFSMLSCHHAAIDEYAGLEHKGSKNITLTTFSFDTIRIDASSTSLEGQWLMNGNKLVFLDKFLVGVKEFDLDGNFLGRYINKGNGPNEVLSPFFVSAYDESDNLVTMDGGWAIQVFDPSYKSLNKPYRLLSDIEYKGRDWQNLLTKPDPEEVQMYEYNFYSKRIKSSKNKLIIPVITEHIRYNGYETGSNARDFWAESYIYMTVDMNKWTTGKVFGHYPPVYQTKNIPVFSDHSFDIYQDKIYASFAADSLIYVRDMTGKLLYSIGYASDSIKGDYPQTKTFDEHELLKTKHLATYGHYGKLSIIGEYIFREYKNDGKSGQYGIQIYRNDEMIGDVALDAPVEIIGKYGDYFYGVLPVNIDNEQFNLVKFQLKEAGSQAGPGPETLANLKFIDKRAVNIGQVKAGTIVERTFAIENAGDVPLVILDARKSCNCTEAEVPSQPLAPGDTGKIAITIDTKNRIGPSTITVSIMANTPEQEHIIRLDMDIVS